MAFNADYLHLANEYGGTVGCKQWVYDTIDATGVVDTADYFAGMCAPAANHKGMEVGDMVLVRIWTTAIPTTTAEKKAATVADAAWHMVITSDATGNASVATETAIVVAAGA
jgi:hypothetical protein